MATTMVVHRTIRAPVETVFEVISDVRNFSKAVPNVTNIEFLSDQQEGKGTRFRETRLINGKEATTELECTEYVEGERVRLVADAGGTIWDTVSTMQPSGSGTELSIRMEARAYKLLPRLINRLCKGFIQREMEKDFDAVKAYCVGGEASVS